MKEIIQLLKEHILNGSLTLDQDKTTKFFSWIETLGRDHGLKDDLIASYKARLAFYECQACEGSLEHNFKPCACSDVCTACHISGPNCKCEPEFWSER